MPTLIVMTALRSVFAFLLLVAFLLFFPTVTAQEASAALLEALTYMPTSQTLVEFTDVELIKRYEGAENLTSQSSAEVKASFMTALSEKHVVSLGNIATGWQQNAELWGFEPTSIRWSLMSSELVVYVIAFQKDFDFTTLKNLFKERGFTQTAYENAVLYQHELDVRADWLQGNLAILNTAILEQEKVLIMSSIPESITTILATKAGEMKSLASEASIQTLAEQLGETAGALLEINACTAYSTSFSLTGRSEELRERFEELASSSLQLYQSLALGYRYEGDQALGTLLLHYTTIEAAQSDLEVRKQGAAEGLSMVVNKPYQESVFGLEFAEVNGNTIIFKLRPVDNKPQRLFSMVYARDMAFAGC